MQKFKTVRLFSLIIFVLLSACGNGNNPNVTLTELSTNVISYDDIVRINNCGGKADSEQTQSRSFATTFEGGAELSAGYQSIAEGSISAKYSQYRNTTKSQRLIAPPGTNMEFVIRWSEEVRAGNVIVNGSSGNYEVRIPISVEQMSSQDLGSCPQNSASNSNAQPTSVASNLSPPQPANTVAPSAQTDCSTMIEGAHHMPILGVEWKFEAINENRIIHIWSNHWSNNLPEYKFFLPAGQSVVFMSGGGSFWTEKEGCNGVAQVIYERDTMKEILYTEYQNYIQTKAIP